jgi:type I restriction enzyme, S subunit
MSEWHTKRLGDVLQLNYGKSLSVKNRIEGAIPVYGSNGIVGSHNEAIVDAPGLIVGRKGSAGQVHRSLGPFCPIDTTFYVTAADAPDTDLEFLFYLLRHIDLTRITGDVGVPGLNREMAYMEPVRFPTALLEQKKIAHILSTVQRAIEAQEQIIQTTTDLKKSLMHKLFTEGLSGEPQKQTEIGTIPESWEVVAFDKFVTLQRGYDLRQQDFREGSVPVIGATQVMGYHDTANVKAPGVTVVRSGSSAGKPLFIDEDFWAHNVLLYVKDFRGNVPKFVYYKILALDLTQYRQGVAVPTLNKNTFSAIELALPSPEEQREIADALDALGNRTDVAERKKAQLQDLFRTLLHELMTAKIHVADIGFAKTT